MIKSKLLLHYKRKEIQDEMVELARDREVAVSFNMQGYGKRPDVLNHANDIIELVKNGATSFHVSEEIWSNVLQINPKLSRKELDDLRLGWDLVLDIDCKILDYSKIAADLLIKALKYHGINSVSCKFSGNHGFHIGVPFKAFPEKVHNSETRKLFPEAPRVIAAYLQSMIRDHLAERVLILNDINIIAQRTDKTYTELVKNNKFDPFEIIEIDTILIASRHLYRMPYSFNEKSNLVSIPIDPDKVLEFDTESAKPENVKVSGFRFLDSKNVIANEARQLILQAYDFSLKQEEHSDEKVSRYEDLQEAIPEQFFPPCVKKILEGLEDGRKRALFVLVNFLTSVGWGYDEIEKRLKEWNSVNKEALREVYLLGQIRYAKQNKKKILPPNCDNKNYYGDLGMCLPDSLCTKVKNPVNYSRRRVWYVNREKGKGKVQTKKD
ncbi:hypothetical protein KY328_01305 [Candidatus Woesearchaeota archaeon]|nr:hypothetical protein [Candidatus Woesearchaeota archaeon]